MLIVSFVLFAGLLLMKFSSAQNFPVIDSSGYLHLAWSNYYINDKKLGVLMNTFQQNYKPSLLFNLEMDLSFNLITNISSLAVVQSYRNIKVIMIDLSFNTNIRKRPGGNLFFGASFSFRGPPLLSCSCFFSFI